MFYYIYEYEYEWPEYFCSGSNLWYETESDRFWGGINKSSKNQNVIGGILHKKDKMNSINQSHDDNRLFFIFLRWQCISNDPIRDL